MTLGFTPVINKVGAVYVIVPQNANAWQRVVISTDNKLLADVLVLLNEDRTENELLAYAINQYTGVYTQTDSEGAIATIKTFLETYAPNEGELLVTTI